MTEWREKGDYPQSAARLSRGKQMASEAATTRGSRGHKLQIVSTKLPFFSKTIELYNPNCPWIAEARLLRLFQFTQRWQFQARSKHWFEQFSFNSWVFASCFFFPDRKQKLKDFCLLLPSVDNEKTQMGIYVLQESEVKLRPRLSPFLILSCDNLHPCVSPACVSFSVFSWYNQRNIGKKEVDYIFLLTQKVH